MNLSDNIFHESLLTFTSKYKEYFTYITEAKCFGSEILFTPQMTGTRQHEDNTTLRVQPCRTASVVTYIMYVRVASPRYAKASCFRLPVEGTILNRTTI